MPQRLISCFAAVLRDSRGSAEPTKGLVHTLRPLVGTQLRKCTNRDGTVAPCSARLPHANSV